MTQAYGVGDELPPLDIPVTRTLIVAGAIASRDYQDVHHDADLAKEKGSPDIFMNILTTNGLVGRYITDHFGPSAVLRKVAIRLGAPNYPGDVLRLTGRITELTEPAGPDGPVGPVGKDPVRATIAVTGDNGIGRHVTGTVTVMLPAAEDLPAPSGERAGA
ncbi:MaoC/PaaZ C-terminal domain-containing protein [Streptomyces sp. CS057]|uniref:MaoC/PaaZ C-terminal domain-containing protein n=1 Tax=Streptomyces sp. CS057 TaxID=1982764 RepID=UPI000B420D3E|nr:MaoC/PaaZ C-terminal domain-containing protein [Streptomyces sp. CS057]OWA23871.1 acyl dehydratase [Streptomyces sp. CS057]